MCINSPGPIQSNRILLVFLRVVIGSVKFNQKNRFDVRSSFSKLIIARTDPSIYTHKFN